MEVEEERERERMRSRERICGVFGEVRDAGDPRYSSVAYRDCNHDFSAMSATTPIGFWIGYLPKSFQGLQEVC